MESFGNQLQNPLALAMGRFRADMIAKIIALCGIVLMLAGCARPGLSCSANGGATRNSGALCAGVIPLNW